MAADTVFDLARTFDTALDESMLGSVNMVYEEMLAGGRAIMLENGVTEGVEFAASADMHYEGQGFDIDVPLPRVPLDTQGVDELRSAFHKKYAETFGYAQPDQPVRATGWKLRAIHSRGEFRWPELQPSGSDPVPVSRRPAYFPEVGGFVDTPVYARAGLGRDAVITGPAIVEEEESTVVLLPGDKANLDRFGNILVEIEE